MDDPRTPSFEAATLTLPLEANGHRITRQDTVQVRRIDGFPDFILDRGSSCANCGQYPALDVATDRVTARTACPLADGITTTITLAVPSGKVVVTDDLRPVYDVDEDAEGFASYNSRLGQAQYIEAMAARGCAYGPVGNSCPTLYRTGDGTYVIASVGEDPGELSGAEPLAWICTDLWAYSIADLEHWQAHGGDPATLGATGTVLEIPAGTYRFTHHTGEATFERYAAHPVIFAHIEKVA